MYDADDMCVVLLGQLQSHDAFWFSLYTFTPELQLGVDGPMENKIRLQALSMESTDWRMVTHLLRDHPETQILSEETKVGLSNWHLFLRLVTVNYNLQWLWKTFRPL